jgi:hypothetical protein
LSGTLPTSAHTNPRCYGTPAGDPGDQTGSPATPPLSPDRRNRGCRSRGYPGLPKCAVCIGRSRWSRCGSLVRWCRSVIVLAATSAVCTILRSAVRQIVIVVRWHFVTHAASQDARARNVSIATATVLRHAFNPRLILRRFSRVGFSAHGFRSLHFSHHTFCLAWRRSQPCFSSSCHDSCTPAQKASEPTDPAS